MMKRSMGWVLAGLMFVAAAPFAAAGCGHSLQGDYQRLCKASCAADNDCENITGIAVDLEKCDRDCENNSDNYAAQVEDKCGADYEILGEKIDRCNASLDQLAADCRADHKSDINADAQHVLSDCSTDMVRCK